MDLTAYRASEQEQLRTRDLLRLMPDVAPTALDIGARDGHMSLLLAQRCDSVTALDLSEPRIAHEKVKCVAGNVCALEFADNSFDLVVCTEVLEHIPTDQLQRACAEIARVTRKIAVIGVPCRQDLRIGKTTCLSCGKINPPWGHVNSFDEARLSRLFDPGMRIEQSSYVGEHRHRTNALSAWLLNVAGNPFGTYEQEEACVHCGQVLQPPHQRSFLQKLCTRAAFLLDLPLGFIASPTPRWIHIQLVKR